MKNKINRKILLFNSPRFTAYVAAVGRFSYKTYLYIKYSWNEQFCSCYSEVAEFHWSFVDVSTPYGKVNFIFHDTKKPITKRQIRFECMHLF